jgi:hypothetical protein
MHYENHIAARAHARKNHKTKGQTHANALAMREKTKSSPSEEQ